ncbi:hypothetical protein [Candidatus Chromulinivorax destructor]|uniref:Uncharacterized protein n=1 Tax=Candidatus Chromulinivorax destructor TaxID=2066483 RepID=A0A345ZC28_9BACT|nr:hypothetical protein [Candidatus Chromulinivorax destructor]AXK60845.1 hypothetical protein C0J27_03815 [Candidatus Chromulinivorax destructor]
MKKLHITICIIFSLIMVNASVLKAMQTKHYNPHIEKMLSLAKYLQSSSSDLVELNDCQEIPVSAMIQYIQENEQGDNLFSLSTRQLLTLTPRSLLVEAYEIAVQNMHKPQILYFYDCHDDSFSDGD